MDIKELAKICWGKNAWSFTDCWLRHLDGIAKLYPGFEWGWGKFLQERFYGEDGLCILEQLVAMEQGLDEAPEDDGWHERQKRIDGNPFKPLKHDHIIFDDVPKKHTYAWIEVRRAFENDRRFEKQDLFGNGDVEWKVFIKTINGRDLMVSRAWSPRKIDADIIARKLAMATGLEIRK